MLNQYSHPEKLLHNYPNHTKNLLHKHHSFHHNYHFHIRLRCPKGLKGCRNQGDPRPKDGTGCGKELDYWFSDAPWKKPTPKFKKTVFVDGIPLPRPKPKNLIKKPKPPKKPKTLASLPSACRAVLTAP